MDQPPGDHTFEILLDYLKRSRGFDFTGYKRTTLSRRIGKRMQQVGVTAYEDYIDFLEVHPEEFTELFNTILINVTGFFRDKEAWEIIAEEIIPQILENKPDGEPVRLWAAGCASGEEAFTLAILMAEAIGEQQFRDRVKIYATDVDEEALIKARMAIYTDRETEPVHRDLLEKYFERSNNHYLFNKELRRSIIFGRHDLIQDASISRIDLLVCRNVLMYLNAETQAKVLARLHFALNEKGFLFLGKAEMLLTQGNLFIPVNLKQRIFAKVPRSNLRDRLFAMVQSGSIEAADNLANHVQIRDAAFDATPVAQIVLGTNGLLALTNDRARRLFGLSQRDYGRPFQDLQVSYRPVELRAAIDQTFSQQSPVVIRDVDWKLSAAELITFDIQVTPLFNNGNGLIGTDIAFIDVTAHKRLQTDLEHTRQELETALEEVQSINEELETTNEELQSTIEELETTNEELQSTNEELETMNEELQSTNEELETINEELRHRTDDLNQVNGFLESILASMRGGVVVMDEDLHVQIWNQRCEDMWGLRSDEVIGQNFFSLDIGLPVEQLKRPIRAILSDGRSSREMTLSAINRRGRSIQCRISFLPLVTTAGLIKGVILVMEDRDESSQKAQRGGVATQEFEE